MSDLIPVLEPTIEGFVTGPWYCDTCGRLIERPKDGYIQWLQKVDEDKLYGLRLVHQYMASPYQNGIGCQYDKDYEYKQNRSVISDSGLREFLGSAGLMRLLVFIDEELLPKDEVIEMAKRLHIKDYEQARGYFESALSEGIIDTGYRPGFYTPNQIEAVKEFAAMRREEQGY